MLHQNVAMLVANVKFVVNRGRSKVQQELSKETGIDRCALFPHSGESKYRLFFEISPGSNSQWSLVWEGVY